MSWRTFLVSFFCLSTVAAADFAPAPGIKLGEGRLHPYLEIDGRFDSLVGYFNPGNGASPDIVLHARPGVKFDLQNDSTLVTFNGNLEYLFYTGLLSPAARNLSRFQTAIGLDAHFNKDGAVEFQIGDQLSRSDRTQNLAATIGVLSLYNNAYIAVPIHPGGKALEVTPRGGFGIELFDPLLTGNAFGCSITDITCNPQLLSQMNYTNINVGIGARWKFFPKTAFVFDSNFDVRNYITNSATNRNVNMLRAQLGIAGLLTPRFSIVLMAGFGGDFALLNTVIGQAELAYAPSENTKVSIGYIRNTSPVPVFGSLANDRGYLSARLGLLNNRFSLTGQFSVDNFSYAGTTVGSSARNDLAIGASATAAYSITSWFDVSLNYALSTRSSNATAITNSYVRHEATLRLNFHY
jgi:hypothetical protein